MESSPTKRMASESRRLASFQEYPLELPDAGRQERHKHLSPVKLARAGFYRENGLASDEVVCFSCGLKVKDWEDDPPIAVHRILRPDCGFLKQVIGTAPRPVQFISDSQFSSPSSTFELFLENSSSSNDNTHENMLRLQDSLSSHDVIDDLMLFENHRLLTFINPLDSQSQAWAKEGFIADFADQDMMVKCVFCGEITSFNESPPEEFHLFISPTCPLVRFMDTGNISRELEERVRRKYGSQPFQEFGRFHRHPQFQHVMERLETFKTWPVHLNNLFPKESMVKAGFFFSGE